MQENCGSMYFGNSARKYRLSVQSIGSKEPLNFRPKSYAPRQHTAYEPVHRDYKLQHLYG